MCHLRIVDNQQFTKRRMSSDLIINAPAFGFFDMRTWGWGSKIDVLYAKLVDIVLEL